MSLDFLNCQGIAIEGDGNFQRSWKCEMKLIPTYFFKEAIPLHCIMGLVKHLVIPSLREVSMSVQIFIM